MWKFIGIITLAFFVGSCIGNIRDLFNEIDKLDDRIKELEEEIKMLKHDLKK